MADEYIMRQDAFSAARKIGREDYDRGGTYGAVTAMLIADELRAIPAADVQPVRHGRWIQHYEPYDTGEEWIEAPYGFECSECGRWEAEKEPFCNCGAKMDTILEYEEKVNSSHDDPQCPTEM